MAATLKPPRSLLAARRSPLLCRLRNKRLAGRTPAKIDSGSGERAMPTLDAFSKHSVLVVDDEESIRMLLAEGLASYGLKVDCAATAEQAMSLILSTKYDVILCDLKLSGSGPNADGYGVALRLKNRRVRPTRPELVFMSGELMSEDNGNLPPGTRRLQKAFPRFQTYCTF